MDTPRDMIEVTRVEDKNNARITIQLPRLVYCKMVNAVDNVGDRGGASILYDATIKYRNRLGIMDASDIFNTIMGWSGDHVCTVTIAGNVVLIVCVLNRSVTQR